MARALTLHRPMTNAITVVIVQYRGLVVYAIVRIARQNVLAAVNAILQGINALTTAEAASACANAARIARPAKTAATRAAGTSACRPVADQIAAAHQLADAHAYVQDVKTARQTVPATAIVLLRGINALTPAEAASAIVIAPRHVPAADQIWTKTAATNAAMINARRPAAQASVAVLPQVTGAVAYVTTVVENAQKTAHARPTRYLIMETVVT